MGPGMHAKEMIDISVKMKNFVSIANPFQAATRSAAIRTLMMVPGVNTYIREGRIKSAPTHPDGAYFGLPTRRRNGAERPPIALP